MDTGVGTKTSLGLEEINTEFKEMLPVETKPDFLLIFATPPGKKIVF